jgi:AcrR family transcriptional regulator
MSTEPQTALERAVSAGEAPPRVTPLDALRAARNMWLEDQRIDMGALARQLQISRATLYNWVGDRERLTAEVLWSIAERTIAEGRRRAKGSGPAYVASVNQFYLSALADYEPTRRFIERDPEFALRVLTGNRTPFQARLIAAVRELIEEQTQASDWQPPLDPETLAYLVIRIGESFIFNNLITGTEPDLQKAVQASRVMLYAAPPPEGES